MASASLSPTYQRRRNGSCGRRMLRPAFMLVYFVCSTLFFHISRVQGVAETTATPTNTVPSTRPPAASSDDVPPKVIPREVPLDVSEPVRPLELDVQPKSTKIKKRVKKPYSGEGKMPSLFMSPEYAHLDKYSACLAATEGLRKMRDAAIAKSSHHRRSGDVWGKLFRHQDVPNKDDPQYRQASAQYVLNSSRIIRALGLSVAQFNQIGRELQSHPDLKEKVMEQAYLYRVTATLNMDKIPIIEDPSSEELLRAHKRRRVQMFARSMNEIEDLRKEQTDKLLRALHIDHLPENVNICDPQVLPLLNPKVRAVCEAFPHQAEEVVRRYGLNSDEFNQMLEEAKGNPVFRWRVKKYMTRSAEESPPINGRLTLE